MSTPASSSGRGADTGSASSALGVLSRLAWLRLRRSKALWITVGLATLPVLISLGGLLRGEPDEGMAGATQLGLRWVIPLLAALPLANAVGEELERQTFTYLWSRPVPRALLVLGKLTGLLPWTLGLTLLSMTIAFALSSGANGFPSLLQLLAGSVGLLVASACLSLGAGSLFPKNPLVFVLGVLLIAETLLSHIPNVRYISIVHHARVLAGLEPPELGTATSGVVGLVVLSTIWLGIGLWRLTRREVSPHA